MTSAPTLEKTLKAHHRSLTEPRELIYDILKHSEPLTMDELVQLALPRCDRASVYRTIMLFEQLGIVQRLQIGWKYKIELSNAFQDHHHHLSCVQCGRIIPLPEDELLESRLKALALAQNFQPQDHQLEIRGLCADCRS